MMTERSKSREAFKKDILAEVKKLNKRHPYGGWLLAAGLAVGVAICAMPMAFVRDADAHGSRAPVRRGPVLPTTCNGSELFVHLDPGPVLMTSDPASCDGVAVWEVATMDEVVDEWPPLIDALFVEPVKVTISGGATNTLVIEEETFDNGTLKLKLGGRNLFITSPSSIDLSTIEGSGNPVDDAAPFGYAVWVEETGGPGACADASLDCIVLGGTLDALTAVEASDNVLVAVVFVQTPATAATAGPLLLDPFFHATTSAMANTQNAAKQGAGLSPVTAIALGGTATSLLTNVAVAWVSSFGGQGVPAFAMPSDPAYLLNGLADASGNEPFQEVANMGVPDEIADGTAFGTTVFFHMAVFQMVYNLGGVSYSRLFLTLPTCTYAANELSDALLDVNNCTSFAKPAGFKALRLIGRLLVKNDTDLIEAIDTPVGSVQTEALTASIADVIGPDGALDGNAAIFDGDGGHMLRDSGTPYPPHMMRIKVDTPLAFLADVDQFLDFDLETDDDDGWFPGSDSQHVEFGFPGKVRCDLVVGAAVDPTGAPKEACVRIYIDDVQASEYHCFLTSDVMPTAVNFGDVLTVVPGLDISLEMVVTADASITATFNCERKL